MLIKNRFKDYDCLYNKNISMDFNKFVRKMRGTPEYDILLEAKEEQNLPLTSKEYLAVFYANDLFDNKFKLPQILKLFPKL